MSNAESLLTFDLAEENAVNGTLEIAAGNNHLGPQADIEVCNIKLRIAELPEFHNYIELYKLKESDLSPEIQDLYRRKDIWQIRHNVGVMGQTSNICNLVQLGFRVKFDDGTIANQELLPQTKYIKPAISGGFTMTADLDASGKAKAAVPAVAQLASAVLPVSADAKAEGSVGIKSNFGLSLSFPALTSSISVVGKGSSYCEWCIDKEDKPLEGDQEFIQVVLVPKDLELITMQVQVYCTVSKVIFNSKRESKWVPITLNLEEGASALG